MNRRTQTNRTPYMLIVAGRAYGSYAEAYTAQKIGEATGKAWTVYGLNDELVASG